MPDSVSTLPTRRSSRWDNVELEKLLDEIKAKKTLKEIAVAHERTTTSISGKLAELAADYHFFDQRPFDEISAITGLTHKQIVNAVERRKAKIMVNERQKTNVDAPVALPPAEEKPMNISPQLNPLPILTLTAIEENEPTLKDIMDVLKNIQKKVEVLERVRVRLETSI
jgi:hypothetical protein